MAQISKPETKQQNKPEIDPLFPYAARQEGARRLPIVQQVVEDVSVDLDSHVRHVVALEWRVPQVANALRRGSEQNNLVAKAFGRRRTVQDARHRNVLVSSVRASVVDEHRAIAAWAQLAFSKLNALNTVFGNVDDNVLVGDLVVLAHCLHGQWRKEILVAIALDERGMPQRAIGVGANI